MKKTKIIISILLICGAAAYLFLSGFGDTMIYYKTVDELVAEQSRFQNKQIHVNGILQEGSMGQKPGTDEFTFKLTKNGKTLTVIYEGILPDSLQMGKELVVEGKLTPQKDVFRASKLLAKCPSKYEQAATDKTIPNPK